MKDTVPDGGERAQVALAATYLKREAEFKLGMVTVVHPDIPHQGRLYR